MAFQEEQKSGWKVPTIPRPPASLATPDLQYWVPSWPTDSSSSWIWSDLPIPFILENLGGSNTSAVPPDSGGSSFYQVSALSTAVETDVAGRLSPRRSTSGGTSQGGRHLIKHWSLSHPTVTLSSAEAELHGIYKSASTPLGLKAIAQDRGWKLSLDMFNDASAAIGTARRRGLCKIRRRAVPDVWIPDRVRSGDSRIVKTAVPENPPDLLTTHLERTLMLKHMQTLGGRSEAGRAGLESTTGA